MILKYLKNSLFLLFFLPGISVLAQEELVPMGANPSLIHLQKTTKNKGGNTPVFLPFYDDFSRADVHLQAHLWFDNDVFVNRTYALDPPTLGVATFDAMDKYGVVYSFATQNSAIMDYLTSNDIRLDSILLPVAKAITPADSVVFSFFIQPGGIGDMPETADSIVLQFYNPNAQTWESVWKHEGVSLDSFQTLYGEKFLMVIIPITNTVYFTSDFKFRFLNYVSIPSPVIPSWRSGLYDFWHLDYVYLDLGRSVLNIHVNDVVIKNDVNTLLKNYISMPWNQFKINAAAEMDYTKTITIENMDASPNTKNISRSFSIYSKKDDSLWSTAVTNINMTSLATAVYSPNYNAYTFNSNTTDFVDFMVMYKIKNGTPPIDFNRQNDTLLFFQKFYNYYAYDDGIPEAGYGLSSAHSKTALKFTLNTPDTLKSIDMYFNQTIGNANQQYFDLVIWADNAGKPGAELYRKSGKRPEFASELFSFYTYKLDNPVYVSGTFYVGMEQVTKDNLNIGFDLNNDNKDKIFYNISGSWINSSFAGSLMIRPILGNSSNPFVSIDQIADNLLDEIRVYPNPLNSGLLNIKYKEEIDSRNIKIEIYNLTSQKVYTSQISSSLELENLPNGMYILRFVNERTHQSSTQKLLIAR